MKKAPRAQVASSFTVIKGALVEESLSYLAAWDQTKNKQENLEAWKAGNPFGAKTQTWLRDVAFVMSRRFDPAGADRALPFLAKANLPLEEVRPILLWHITRDEFIFRDFLIEWLFPAWDAGVYQVAADDIHEHLLTIGKRGGVLDEAWSPSTLHRVATSLLAMATAFGLLQGKIRRTFLSYHLSDFSLLYLLHALRDANPSPRKVIQAKDWRMFLMRPDDVERELLRLHQFRKLTYHTAGSIIELGLPAASANAYAEGYAA